MAGSERDEIILQLQKELSDLEVRFDVEARKRGFDPAQAENMALPSALARLFAKCEEIRTELGEITGKHSES